MIEGAMEEDERRLIIQASLLFLFVGITVRQVTQ